MGKAVLDRKFIGVDNGTRFEPIKKLAKPAGVKRGNHPEPLLTRCGRVPHDEGPGEGEIATGSDLLFDPDPLHHLQPVLALELGLLDVGPDVLLEVGMRFRGIVYAGEKDDPGVLGDLGLLGILRLPVEEESVGFFFDVDLGLARGSVAVAGDVQCRGGFDAGLQCRLELYPEKAGDVPDLRDALLLHPGFDAR
jgi:hypothetical protein